MAEIQPFVPNNKPYVEKALCPQGGMHIDGVDKVSYSLAHPCLWETGGSSALRVSDKGRTAENLDIAPELTGTVETEYSMLKELEYQAPV